MLSVFENMQKEREFSHKDRYGESIRVHFDWENRQRLTDHFGTVFTT